MLESVRETHSYGPETLAVMTTAFEHVCRSLPEQAEASAAVRRRLAAIIFRLVDDGERDLTRLSALAFARWR